MSLDIAGQLGEDSELRSPTLVGVHLHTRWEEREDFSHFIFDISIRDQTLVRFSEDGEKEDFILTLREKDEDFYDFLQDELKIFYKICAQMESKLNQ